MYQGQSLPTEWQFFYCRAFYCKRFSTVMSCFVFVFFNAKILPCSTILSKTTTNSNYPGSEKLPVGSLVSRFSLRGNIAMTALHKTRRDFTRFFFLLYRSRKLHLFSFVPIKILLYPAHRSAKHIYCTHKLQPENVI